MHSPDPAVRSSETLARIDRLIARLPELDEQHLEGIEANLYELSARCEAEATRRASPVAPGARSSSLRRKPAR